MLEPCWACRQVVGRLGSWGDATARENGDEPTPLALSSLLQDMLPMPVQPRGPATITLKILPTWACSRRFG